MAKHANMTPQEIRDAVECEKYFVVLNVFTGAVISLHKSYNGAQRKAAKVGYPAGVNDFRAGYIY